MYDEPPIEDSSNPTRLTFALETIVPYEKNRRATNGSEVTPVNGADEIRTVLVDEPKPRGLLLCAYHDLRGSIKRSPQVAINEIVGRVVSDPTKLFSQIDERGDDELPMLKALLVKNKRTLRGLRDQTIAPPPAPADIESVDTNTDY